MEVRLPLLLLLALAGAVPAAEPVSLEEAQGRLQALEGLVRKSGSGDAELIDAIEMLGAACTGLAADTDGKEAERFRDAAGAVLLKALQLERIERGTARNARSEVQLAAARTIHRAGPRIADDLMRVIERRFCRDRDYEVDPSFHDAVLDPLVRLQAEGTFEWILEEAVNADVVDDRAERAAAGLDALCRLGGTGEQRRRAVKRILAIYQSFAFHLEDDAFEVTGFRSTKKQFKKLAGEGPYWERMRPTVMRALRLLSTDPRTGLPPFDLDTGGEIGTLERHKVWFAQNKTAGRPPWVDGDGSPRARAAVPYTRPLSPVRRAFGVPWTDTWALQGMILQGPVAAAPWRDALRTATLPPLLDAALRDEAWPVRAAAAVTVGRLGAEGAAARLHACLAQEPVEAVREAAVLGLLLLEDPAQAGFFRAAIVDAAENPRVRAYAVLALGLEKDAATLRGLLRGEGLPPDPPDVAADLRACAVHAVGLTEEAGAAGEVAALLADRRGAPAARGAAGPALLALGDARALLQGLPVLRERIVRGEVPVAPTGAAIAAALAGPGDRKTLRILERALRDADGDFAGVRTLLAGSLGRIGGPHAVRVLADEYRRVRSRGTRCSECGHFLLALGRAGGDEAKELLRAEFAALDHPVDRGACAIALALAGDTAALPEMRAGLVDLAFAPYGVTALALLGDSVAPGLVREALRRGRSDATLQDGALALALAAGENALPDLLALWERGRRPEHFDAFAWAFRLAGAEGAVAPLQAIVAGPGDPVERAFALLALGRMAAPAPPLHRLVRDVNVYAGSPTLLDLVRWRDAAPLLD